MSHFVVKDKKKLSDLNIGDKIEESDFATICPDGSFVQLEYVDEDKDEKYEVKPGVYSILGPSSNLQLKPAEFIQDKILESFVNTKQVEDNIECFINNIQAYYDHGIEVPKLSLLLFGPAGTGKSTSISKICGKYNDGETLIINWNTDRHEAYDVKYFINRFDYKNVKRLFLIAEDLGGVEIDQARFKSDSSLLSLLDNKTKTFKIPTVIISTTNFPENFLGNLTNRPERFDDKIEIGYPDGNVRAELLKFFSKVEPEQEALDLLKSKKCEKFTPAHIRQIVIRSATRSKTHVECINQILEEIKYYENAFSKKNNLGMMGFSD